MPNKIPLHIYIYPRCVCLALSQCQQSSQSTVAERWCGENATISVISIFIYIYLLFYTNENTRGNLSFWELSRSFFCLFIFFWLVGRAASNRFVRIKPFKMRNWWEDNRIGFCSCVLPFFFLRSFVPYLSVVRWPFAMVEFSMESIFVDIKNRIAWMRATWPHPYSNTQ